jgi:hypothetical protein
LIRIAKRARDYGAHMKPLSSVLAHRLSDHEIDHRVAQTARVVRGAGTAEELRIALKRVDVPFTN